MTTLVRILNLSLLAIALGVTAAAADTPVENEDMLWTFARSLLSSGAHDQARTEFNRFRSYFPASPRARWATLLEGICLVQLGQFDGARTEFNRLDEPAADPLLSLRSRLEIAKSYYFEGEWDSAEPLLLESIRRQDSMDREVASEALLYLGWMRLDRGKGHEASSLFAAIPDNTQLAPYRQELIEKSLPIDETGRKSPLRAGLLAAVLPGAGHAYVGRWSDAATSLVLNAVFGFASYEAFHRRLYLVGGLAGFAGLTWYAGNVYGAVSHAHKYNRDRIVSQEEQFPIRPGGERILAPE